MEYINHQSFYHMILSGARQIIVRENELNRINVFPVADGDTGSNLAYLMRMIVRETRWTEPSSVTLAAMKEACLKGSRGNSGMIFSQFIISMCEFMEKRQQIRHEEFLQMCDYSVKRSYEAVHEPQEGTVLTVMKDWVYLMGDTLSRSKGILEMLQHSFGKVCVSLENTKAQLKALQAHNVVDAGAKGFVHFVQGFMEYMLAEGAQSETAAAALAVGAQGKTAEFAPEGVQSETAAVAVAEAAEADLSLGEELEEHRHIQDEPLKHRYCTEFLFDIQTDLETIKRLLLPLGDSAVVLGSGSKGKVHIHTNHPDQAAAVLHEHGSIVYQKVEDMQRQQEMIYRRKSRVAIVVDSACDLPAEWMDRYQIHMLPLQLQVGRSAYLDKVTIEPDQFYNLLEESEEHPRTSQPQQEAAAALYRRLLEHYEEVISIHISKQLSGTLEACRRAARETSAHRIHVLDSRTLSGAYGLLAKAAGESALAGRNAEDIILELEGLLSKTEILVSVPTLKHMVRGGRVSPLKGWVAKLLDMKPIVSVDQSGKSLLYGKTFFRKSNAGKLFEMVRRLHSQNPIGEYVVLHAGSGEAARLCRDEMMRITGREPVYTTGVSPVIGLHAGKGAFSIAMLLQHNHVRRKV